MGMPFPKGDTYEKTPIATCPVTMQRIAASGVEPDYLGLVAHDCTGNLYCIGGLASLPPARMEKLLKFL